MKARTLRVILPLIFAAVLAACGSSEKIAKSDILNDSADAALHNLEDMNIKRDEIHEKLAALIENPYSTPKPLKCKMVKEELAILDAILGPDVDAKRAELSENEEYADAAGEMIHDGIVGIVRSHTGFLPFRSIVRRITGAASHEKAVREAQQAGKLRRAYLKGLAGAKFGKSCVLAPVVTAANTANDPADPKLEVAAQ